MAPPGNSLASARQFLASGNVQQAERAYNEAIAEEPESVEAWEFLIRCRIASKEILAAMALLHKTPERIRSHASLQLLSGVAFHAVGDLKSAEAAFRSASAEILVARLHLAAVLDDDGRRDEALTHYFGAINSLQEHGVCRDEASTPPAVRGLVLHSMKRINEGRRALFESLLAPHIEKHGREELKRMQDALAIYLGDRAADYTDPRQRPTFFYVPGLPTAAYHPVDELPWVAELQERTGTIREELTNLMQAGAGIELVHQLTGQALEPYVRSSRSGGNWKGAYFYRHGEAKPENVARCPATSAAIEALPLARVRDHGPEVLFSVLDPGTEILPHRGVTNTRLVLHLPLIVPPDCALDVSGEVHHWQEGRCVMFDDTFEHRAWNRSPDVRVILIADVWNPALTLPEREAISALVSGIGDFNRSCGL